MPVSPLLVGFQGKEKVMSVAYVRELAAGADLCGVSVWWNSPFPMDSRNPRDGQRVEEPVPAEEPVVADDSAKRFVGSGGPDDVSHGVEAEEDVLQDHIREDGDLMCCCGGHLHHADVGAVGETVRVMVAGKLLI
jgi:hypothetical protein